MGDVQYNPFPKKVKAAGRYERRADTTLCQKVKATGVAWGSADTAFFPKSQKRRGVAIEYAGRVGENIK